MEPITHTGIFEREIREGVFLFAVEVGENKRNVSIVVETNNSSGIVGARSRVTLEPTEPGRYDRMRLVGVPEYLEGHPKFPNIKYRHGDILLNTEVDAVANPVNCVGAMGAGLAKTFAETYPQIVPGYREACRDGSLRVGRVQLHDLGEGAVPRWIVNFPTKDHWKDPSQLEWIRAGLIDTYRQLRKVGAESIALPALGAGLGGLPWVFVHDLIVDHASENPDIDITIYLPS